MAYGIQYRMQYYRLGGGLTTINLLKKNTENKNVFVTVRWDNDFAPNAKNSIQSVLGTGALVIPLGSNCNWLLNSHSTLSISVEGLPDGSPVAVRKLVLLKSTMPKAWLDESAAQ